MILDYYILYLLQLSNNALYEITQGTSPKGYLKSTIFFATGYISVKPKSMSFGATALGHFKVTSHQPLNFHFAILKQTF